MAGGLIFDLDKDIADSLEDLSEFNHELATDRFMSEFMSILLYAYMLEGVGPLEFESSDALLKLTMEYFDRDQDGDRALNAGELIIQAFKHRYRYHDQWIMELERLVPLTHRHHVCEYFDVEFSRGFRYAYIG